MPDSPDLTDSNLIDAWDDMDQSLPLDDRMIRVEKMMRAFRDSEAASTSLGESVDRLGINANSLGETLLKVAQAVAALDAKVEQTRAQSMTKQDAAEHEEVAARTFDKHRQQVLRRVYTATAVIGAFLCGALLTGLAYLDAQQRAQEKFQRATYQVCSGRDEQARLIRQFLLGQRQQITQLPVAQQPAAQRQIDLLERAFPNVNCEELK